MLAEIKRHITNYPTVIKPKVGLLNPAFVYRSAAMTDIRQTFSRVRAEQAASK